MNTIAEKVASYLLDIKAIKLDPNHPFTWASGWKSPIYCDNRKTLSYPEVRTYIKEQFVALIREKYPEVEVIAGVATGAIAQGVLVAQELNLPFIYVRSSAKSHGLENIFTYGFQKAEDNFQHAACSLTTLSNYSAMIDLALKIGYVKSEQIEKLKAWRLSPETYK